MPAGRFDAPGFSVQSVPGSAADGAAGAEQSSHSEQNEHEPGERAISATVPSRVVTAADGGWDRLNTAYAGVAQW